MSQFVNIASDVYTALLISIVPASVAMLWYCRCKAREIYAQIRGEKNSFSFFLNQFANPLFELLYGGAGSFIASVPRELRDKANTNRRDSYRAQLALLGWAAIVFCSVR